MMGRNDRYCVGAGELFGRWFSRAALLHCAIGLFALACSKQAGHELEFSKVEQALSASDWPADGLVVASSTHLDSGAQVNGNITVRLDSSAPLAGGRELVLEANARIMGNARAKEIFLSTDSRITGDAQYTVKTGPGQVEGVNSSPLATPVAVAVPSLPTVSPGAQAITVAAGTTLTRASGAYGAVTLNPSASPATRLILTGGTYHFSSLTVGYGARVECSADCELRVDGRVAADGFSFIGPNAGGLTPRDIRLVVKGANGAAGPMGLPSAMRIVMGSQVFAYILAPNGTVVFGSGVEVRGKIVAKDVYWGPQSSGILIDQPTITQHPVNASVRATKSATFSATATGVGLTYQWKRNGANITGATSSTLTFTANSSHNGVTHTVVVTNAAGSVTSNGAVLSVIPCTATDTTCNGEDEDCNGTNDEDYVPACQGASRLLCTNGAVVTSPCGDSNACNGTETCSAGSCQAGTPPDLTSTNPCSNKFCDPSAGVVHYPSPEGASCTDGNVCNGGETCNGLGVCLAGTPLALNDNNPCTADSCDPTSGVVHAPVESGTSCSDTNPCNGEEVCNGSGSCVVGTQPFFEDGRACTIDSCDPILGIIHTPAPAGRPCPDRNLCNGYETCDGSGRCVAGTPPNLDDNNPCTRDACIPFFGPVHPPAPASTPCPDGNLCNGEETCNATRVCLGGTPPVVDDDNPCTADSCDPLLGVVHQPVAAGTQCSDGNACNGEEACSTAGQCQAGTPLPYGLATGCCDASADTYPWETLELDPTLVTTYAMRALPLFLGEDRSQAPLDEEVIDQEHVAVARGRVLDEAGAPVACAQVSVLHQDEIGSVRTLVDGSFALAVNGGEPITLQYLHPSFMTSHRRLATQPLKDVFAPDVKLIPYGAAHPVSASATNVTVVAGEVETDPDGTRQVAMLVPPGTTATIEGETVARSDYAIRAKEVTNRAEVGHEGMMATLPPQSMFTYAVSFDVAGAEGKDVVLSKSIPVYVENFIGFPVGETAPVGRYDVKEERWVAVEPQGRVIQIVGLDSGGSALLDINFTPGADDPSSLGVNDAERAALATRYAVGTSLWRFQVNHFSLWDVNWPGGPGPDDTAPSPDDPSGGGGGGGGAGGAGGGDGGCAGAGGGGAPNCSNAGAGAAPGPNGPPMCSVKGSIIECEGQILKERLPVNGTPFELVYSSARQPGRSRELEIPLIAEDVPQNLRQIELRVQVAGQEFTSQYPRQANQTHHFVWDGRDKSGRIVSGTQKIGASIGYTYPIVYQRTERFGYNGNGTPITGSMDRGEVTIWKHWSGEIGSVNSQYAGLGGWTLDVHHVLDPDTGTVYLGDGSEFKVPSEYSELVTVAGIGTAGFTNDGGLATQAQIDLNGFEVNSNLVVTADGTIYFADSRNNRVRRVSADGIISTVAGGGSILGDGGPAIGATLNQPSAVALGMDGNLYIADSLQHRIRKVDLDTGIITTVVGTGVAGFSCNDGTPTTVTLNKPTGLTIAPDGTMFIADSNSGCVRRVADGKVTGAARNLNYPTGVAVGPDGTIYFSHYHANQIGKIRVNGQVEVAVGNGSFIGTPPFGDGGPALSAQLLHPDGVSMGPDGLLYFVDTEHHLVRRVNAKGNVESLVGTGAAGYSGEGLPATRSRLWRPRGFTVAPDGSIYVVDSENHRIRRVRKSSRATSSSGGLLVPLAGGSQIAEFDADGRHLRTVDAYSGATVLAFGYDVQGRLTSVADVDGRVTLINRNGAGRATSIQGPDGQTTAMAVEYEEDGDILEEFVRPDQGRYVFTYEDGGLLSTMRDPKLEDEGGNSFVFGYENGRLVSDTDPLGGEQTLTHEYTPGGWKVTRTTPLGRSTTFEQHTDAESYKRIVTNPDGTKAITEGRRDLKQVFAAPNGKSYDERVQFTDGSIAYYLVNPAPVWGLSAPITSEGIRVLPSGLTRTEQSSHELVLDPVTASLLSETRTSTINGKTQTVEWDAATRTFVSTSAGGRTSFHILDDKGRTFQMGAPGIETTQFDYDQVNGKLLTIQQGARLTSFGYESASGPTKGTLKSVTDALQQETTYSRDSLGRVTEVTSPDDKVTGFGWDANSNLEGVVPPGKPLHAQSFDALNQRRTYAPPALQNVSNVTTVYTPDQDRNPLNVQRPDGNSLMFVYDTTGKLDGVQTPTGLFDYQYYSAAPAVGGSPGAVRQIATPAGVSLSYTYDGPLVKSETLAATGLITSSIAWAYDADFRISSETLTSSAGSSSVKFGYEADNLKTCLSVGTCSPPDSGALVTTYDPDLPRPETSSVGALQSQWFYNNYGELSGLQTTSGGSGVVFKQELELPGQERDALGRVRVSRVVNGGTTQTSVFGYDERGRLETVTTDGTLAETYVYDGNGNRLALMTPSGTVEGNYDAQDRMLAYGTFEYTYTAYGDLLTKTDTVSGDQWTYTYDVRGNLVQVSLPNGDLIEYLVDGLNRRVGKRINGTLVRQWVWASQYRIAAELDGTGNVLSRFLYGNLPSTPELVVRSGGTYQVISDHLGSVRAVVNVTNPSDVLARLDYTAFGEVSGIGIGVLPQGFAGGLYDTETELLRFGVRDYDPTSGRWVSKDPVLWDGGQENLFVYVGNNPVNLIDPDGKIPIALPLIEDGVGAAILACGAAILWLTEQTEADEAEEEAYSCVDQCYGYMHGGAVYYGKRGAVRNDRYGNAPYAFYACLEECEEARR